MNRYLLSTNSKHSCPQRKDACEQLNITLYHTGNNRYTKMRERLPLSERGLKKHRQRGGEIFDLGVEGCVRVHQRAFARAFTTDKSSRMKAK